MPHRQEIAELGAIAGGTLNIAIGCSIPRPVCSRRWMRSRSPRPFPARELRLTVEDEAGKMDLNTVPPDLLLRLLTSAGLDLMVAQRLADCTLRARARRGTPGLSRRSAARRGASIAFSTSASASAGLSPKAEQDCRSGTSATQAPSGSDQNRLIRYLAVIGGVPYTDRVPRPRRGTARFDTALFPSGAVAGSTVAGLQGGDTRSDFR
jgi:hypothetical protein